ncbi:MAG: TraR/DksA C4-type zinc finger protein [Acidobacteriaceae bacterium]|nr:TraR/DksA C4-type zinc finger protein [Acidobacteriaceae bacterium]
MSGINVTEFCRLLQAKYDELSSASISRDEIIIETTADEMDRLQQQLGRDMAIRNLDRTSTLLKGIRAALDRIEDDIYGVCLRCEEPIAEKRLKAVPWAQYCVGCQETIDQYQALAGEDDDTIAFAA